MVFNSMGMFTIIDIEEIQTFQILCGLADKVLYKDYLSSLDHDRFGKTTRQNKTIVADSGFRFKTVII